MEYPYNRSEECSWQPEEVARHLSTLATSRGPSTKSPHGATYESESHQNLLSRGWESRHVSFLRGSYGANVMDGDKSEDSGSAKGFVGRAIPCLTPILVALAGQLKEPLILMLLASAGLSVFLGNTADAISIGIALLIVSFVAAVQEWRSEQALDKLNNLVPHTCTVLRDGRVLDGFLARELVVGDLVLLATGDRVPADCRVVDSVELTLDESSLTGENHPVGKTGEGVTLTANPPLTLQRNVVFAGSLVNAGRGRALVIAVGEFTEFGKVATELSSVTSRKSPLQIKIDELGKRLAALSSLAILIIAVLGWVMGRPFLETVTVAVSLAVAAIPEGLPICVTVTLALGVLRMARMNAIVKKLPAVESLGCATVVASDKTGTLTQNEMTARSVYSPAFPHENFGFTGVGYDPKHGDLVTAAESGTFAGSGKAPLSPRRVPVESREFEALAPLFHVASLCNNASIATSASEDDAVVDHNVSQNSGQPTELALLVASIKANVPDPRPLYHRTQEIPFSSDRKRMEVRARPVSGTHSCRAFQEACQSKSIWQLGGKDRRNTCTDGSLYFVKGMPEAVLGECTAYRSSDATLKTLCEERRTLALSQSRRMAAGGLRVLAMAYGSKLEELTFAGLLGMEDPPRAGVADAVQQLKAGGVKVMMVTGDSKETALAIARRCNILTPDSSFDDFDIDGSSGVVPNDGAVNKSEMVAKRLESTGSFHRDIEFGGASVALSGEELDAFPPGHLADSIAGVRVFYRVAPRHKLTIVRALQSQGEIVSMTGDGVNDATALKGADIGVAMGLHGTDVAKEAADIVLADDNFTTITKAIAEGKGIFFNIRNFLSFQLSTSFAAITMASVATAFGLPSPLNAMQILFINVIMDGPPAQSLGVEPVDEKILKAKPRKASEGIVTKALLARAVTSAALIVYLTLKVFSNELDDGAVTRRDTTMTFMTFVNCDLLNAYVCRSSERTFYELSPSSNPAFLWAIGGSVLFQLLIIYFPPLQEVFQTEALSGSDILYIISLSTSVLWLDTLRKKFFSSWFSDAFQSNPRSKKEDGEPRRVQRVGSWLNFRQLDRASSSGKKTAMVVRNRNMLAL